MVVRIGQFPLLSASPAFDFQREFDDLFGDFLGTGLRHQGSLYPPIDIAEYENKSIVVMELPGVKKDDVKISIQDGTMTISGQRKDIAVPRDGKVLWNERNDGDFLRTVRLPHEVNLEQVSADLVDGMLTIELPKAETAKPRKIEVK